MWMNKQANELDFVRNTQNKFTDSVGKQNKAIWKSYNIDATNTNTNTAVSGQQTSNPTIKYSVSSPEPYPSVITSYTYSSISSIGPLCPTQWGQDNPFNTLCPAGNYSVNHTPAGCVPVAIAQILYFWRFPGWYDYPSMPLNKVDAGSYPSNGYNIYELSFIMSDLGGLLVSLSVSLIYPVFLINNPPKSPAVALMHWLTAHHSAPCHAIRGGLP